MAVLVQAEANRLLDASFGTAAYTAPTTPMKMALVTVLGTATAAGTEVTGGSYARQTLTMGSSSAGSNSNTVALTYSNMPAVTVVGVDVYDSNATPRRGWFGPLAASRTTLAGDTLTFAIGGVTASLT